MTDTKNSELPQTDSALAELSAALLHLNELASAKKQQLGQEKKKNRADLDHKKKKLELLKDSCSGIVANIDNIIEKLDKVLETNGTSNNNHQ